MPATPPNKPVLQFGDDSEFYATCGAGLAQLLAEELESIGCARIQVAGAGVRFFGSIETGYRVCLWSRVANRVLLPIHRGDASDPDELYEMVRQVDWSAHLDKQGTLAVDFYTANSSITHSRYGALKVKDAVVDQFRESTGLRPDVDRDTPDLRINVYLFRNKARIAIDFSGSSLHRRGYRVSGGRAPMKENLAAALLMASGWPEQLKTGMPLIDPLCGSGTLLIEAAMMARRQAPGLHRSYFGFIGWKHHNAASWSRLVSEAESSVVPASVKIVGADNDPSAVASSQLNVVQAGLVNDVEVIQWNIKQGRPPSLESFVSGVLISNPPYGERLAADDEFYEELGMEVSRSFAGWQCSLFTSQSAPYGQTRLPLEKKLEARNGGIDCVLVCADVPDSAAWKKTDSNVEDSAAKRDAAPTIDTTALTNRLKKNLRNLKTWINQNEINAYRVYDADLPDFAVAIDLYEGKQRYCVVQEYQAPITVNVAIAQARLAALISVLPDTLDVSEDHIHLKIRAVKPGRMQYEKLHNANSVIDHVIENGASVEINFADYLDVGLFLDHRPIRKFIAQNANGKRFLNLFCYTATATVAAVIGGASGSVSVDSSNRYCQWARRNLDGNGADAHRHEVIRQDALSWLDSASISLNADERFDMILLDPPTFSNSTDREKDWNIQRDHVSAVNACIELLGEGGLLIFSTNYRKFKFEKDALSNKLRGIRVEERTRWSIDRDFQRNQRIHQCWFIYK